MVQASFLKSQNEALDRYGVTAVSRRVDAPSVDGQAHVLVCGEGPPAILINGIGTPAVMWAPLMAEIAGHTLHAIDLPGYGLTDTTPTLTDTYRSTAVKFLGQVLDGLGLDSAAFVTNSLGSLWASWLAIDSPHRVTALAFVGCPAVILDTSAPLPMRVLSTRLGPLLMKLQPPSPRQVTQLSKMVKEHPLPAEIAALVLATEQLPGFELTFLSTLRTLIRLRGSRPEMALTAAQLSAITQPTVLILGRDDPMGAEPVGRKVVEAIQGSELHMVEGGHAPWVHHSAEIAPLLMSFLHGRGS